MNGRASRTRRVDDAPPAPFRPIYFPALAAGTGEDTGEALLQGKERGLQTAVADGREYHGDGEGHGVAEEVAARGSLPDRGPCSR